MCTHHGCSKFAQSHGLCMAHGGSTPLCKFDACNKLARTGGFCQAHGGRRAMCQHPDGCGKHAQIGRMCIEHGGHKATCKHPDGCRKRARRGGYCYAHGGEMNTPSWNCRSSGCRKRAVKGGLCRFHGSQAEQLPVRCKHPDGCRKWALPLGGGYCRAHGGETNTYGMHGPQAEQLDTLLDDGATEVGTSDEEESRTPPTDDDDATEVGSDDDDECVVYVDGFRFTVTRSSSAEPVAPPIARRVRLLERRSKEQALALFQRTRLYSVVEYCTYTP